MGEAKEAVIAAKKDLEAAEVSVGDGGFISANVYGGFTRAHREALSVYRQNYFPHIKISLLPVEKLSFISLSDWQKNPERKSNELNTMIANFRGSGDYLGIAIVMNITMPQDSATAQASLACKDVFDPYKCGELRDEVGETVSRPVKPVAKDDEVRLVFSKHTLH